MTNNDRKQKTPGRVFVTYRYENDRVRTPVHLDIRDADATEMVYMAEAVAKHLHKERIPDLRIACYDYDDISALPPVGSTEPGDYLKANRSIQEQNRDRIIWHRSVIESAYCIENGRNDYCNDLTAVCLVFDPNYTLYRTVNDLGLRHYYRDMSGAERSELLRRLNESNPRLELKELPKIGGEKNEKKKTKGRSH